jgi:predicted SAM-dependent methyltransferase
MAKRTFEDLMEWKQAKADASDYAPYTEKMNEINAAGPGGLKLNLGSGQRPFPAPWVNVDCQEKWMLEVLKPSGQGIFLKADIREMPMFADGSAETIVLWHVIEHFGCGEADPIIKECYRILQPGGELIVATPDLAMLAARYLDTKDGSRVKEPLSEQVYVTNLYGAYMGDEADRHKWGWSQEGLLEYLAKCAPWRNVLTWDGKAPEGTDIAKDWWMSTAKAVK